MTRQMLYTPQLISLAESTLCEEDSFYLLSNFEQTFSNYEKYSVSDELNIESIINVITTFSTFHSRIKISQNSTDSIASVVPLDVLRYKMLEDQSFHYVKTAPSSYKPGYIVEGAWWSNGMYYVVREESISKSESSPSDMFLDAVLYIDQYTKGLYNYP